jgi:hypothetical protein
LKEQGLIEEEERLGVSFPNYYRMKEVFMEAFDDYDISSRLKVVSIEERVVRCPYRELYTSGKLDKSPRQYAEWFTPTMKTWSHSTFKNGLKSGRSKDEKEDTMNKFWENLWPL